MKLITVSWRWSRWIARGVKCDSSIERGNSRRSIAVDRRIGQTSSIGNLSFNDGDNLVVQQIIVNLNQSVQHTSSGNHLKFIGNHRKLSGHANGVFTTKLASDAGLIRRLALVVGNRLSKWSQSRLDHFDTRTVLVESRLIQSTCFLTSGQCFPAVAGSFSAKRSLIDKNRIASRCIIHLLSPLSSAQSTWHRVAFRSSHWVLPCDSGGDLLAIDVHGDIESQVSRDGSQPNDWLIQKSNRIGDGGWNT